jgi:signal transduction histidine kinase
MVITAKKSAAVKKKKPTCEELLDENARLRGDLLTIARRISHDLRTPLGGIIGTGEALKEILAETDPGSLALVSTSLNSADELSGLIKRISFVLKATASPSLSQSVAMGEVVSAVLERLESKILKNRVKVFQPESWPQPPGVSDWLETIWWNLLANALRHAPTTSRLELGWREEKEEFYFWVADDGPGISNAKRDKLFQPFHSLHETDAASGLGLPIVQRLIELQGGRCGYKPNPNGGAFFFFTLPVDSPAS